MTEFIETQKRIINVIVTKIVATVKQESQNTSEF